MHGISVALFLLAVAALTNGVVRALKVPLPLVQIAAGTLLAWPLGLSVELDPDVFLLVFIPPLLFIEGFRIPKRDFHALRWTILTMAFGLVILTVVVIGFLVRAVAPAIPLFVAFALASALSPTDAIAVGAVSSRTPVPPRLMHVLQGEALLNDASGLVCLRVAVAAIAAGTFSWGRAAGSLVVVAVGGIAIGAGVAWVFARLQRLVFGREDDAPEGRVLLVVTLPYAAYLLAEHAHVSGILAAVAAGMILPRLDVLDVGERVTRLQTGTVLSALEQGLNGVVFVLLGLQLPGIMDHASDIVAAGHFSSFTALVLAIAATGVGLFVVRYGWVWISFTITLHLDPELRAFAAAHRSRVVLAATLAGARGAVSLAATLTLPVLVTTPGGPYPARAVGVCIAAAVILLSLVAASFGLPLALRGVKAPPDDTLATERARLRIGLVDAAIAAIEREAAAAGATMTPAAQLVRDGYRRRRHESGTEDAKHEEAARQTRLVGIAAERAHLQALWAERAIADELYREALQELDVVEEALRRPTATRGDG